MTESEWLASNDLSAMLAALQRGMREHATDPFVSGGTQNDKPSDRKLRLFAVACCRQGWGLLIDDAECEACEGTGWYGTKQILGPCPGCSGTGRINRFRRAVEVAERYADGLATVGQLNTAFLEAYSVDPVGLRGPAAAARHSAYQSGGGGGADQAASSVIYQLGEQDHAATQVDLLRCIVGNPWRPVTLSRHVECKACDGYGLLGEDDNGSVEGVQCGACRGFGTAPHPWLTWNDGAVPKMARTIYDDRSFDLLPILADALEDAGCDNADILAHCRGPGPHARGCWVIDLLLGKE